MIDSTFKLSSSLLSPTLPQQAGRVGADKWALEIIRDEENFLALEPCWKTLLKQSATQTPFLHWDWVSLWWEACRGQVGLAIGVVRNAMGEAVAIAPCVLGRGGGSRLFMRQLAFVGGLGPIRGEGMDFIIPQGMEATFAPVLGRMFTALRPHWDVASLMMLPESSPNHPWILAGLQAAGVGAGIAQRRVSPYLNLPKNWQELEMQQSANWRSTHRRKWNKAVNGHQARTLLAGRDVPADLAFDALVRLHRHRFSEEQSAFLDPRALEFHRRLIGRWIGERRIQLTILELDGHPQSATYCFVDDGKASQYQAGWHPDYAGLSIGRLGMGCAIQAAMEAGLREFDFLPGDGPHKRLWTQQARQLDDLRCFHPRSLRAGLLRLVQAVRRRTRPATSEASSPQED